MQACDLLVTGGTVITVDDRRRVIDPGAVAVTGERIVDVGTVADLGHYEANRVIDASGGAVLPGLVDTHQHLFQYLTRGLGEGLELWPWLSDFMWPVTTAITTAEARIGAQLGGGGSGQGPASPPCSTTTTRPPTSSRPWPWRTPSPRSGCEVRSPEA